MKDAVWKCESQIFHTAQNPVLFPSGYVTVISYHPKYKSLCNLSSIFVSEFISVKVLQKILAFFYAGVFDERKLTFSQKWSLLALKKKFILFAESDLLYSTNDNFIIMIMMIIGNNQISNKSFKILCKACNDKYNYTPLMTIVILP